MNFPKKPIHMTSAFRFELVRLDELLEYFFEHSYLVTRRFQANHEQNAFAYLKCIF